MELSYGVIPIYRSDNDLKFLLIQGKDTNDWSFPKGHLEPDEKPTQTALRELREETGINKIELIPDLSFRDEYEYKEKEQIFHKAVTLFVGFVDNLNVITQPEEIEGHQWVNYDQAIAILSFNSQKKILKKVLEFINDRGL
jgi:8-oxo-dGTP pyrophosphatase MutT (NUDIX family)